MSWRESCSSRYTAAEDDGHDCYGPKLSLDTFHWYSDSSSIGNEGADGTVIAE